MKSAKRFYQNVDIIENDGLYSVTLDGRPLKTPAKKPLSVDRKKAAELIAAEWDAQDDDIRPETMPVTRLVNVAIELTPDNRPMLIAEARKYAGTDLLCYRVSEPVTLANRQKDQWGPVLSWAAGQGIELEITSSVLAIEQSEASLDKIAEFATGLDDLDLTLMVHLTAVYGSAVLAMAVMDNHLTGSQAFDLSRLDNLYQIEQWGEDEEAAEIAANLAAEVAALCQILER